MPGKPPLGLMAELVDGNGAATTLSPNDPNAGNRPQDISFSTEQGEGFGSAGFNLARRYDRDYVDLQLFNEVGLYGEDGDTAYEGQITSIPRSLADSHSIAVSTEGWMGHARRRTFVYPYVDRAPAWRPAGYTRQATNLLAGLPWGSSYTWSNSTGLVGIFTGPAGVQVPAFAINEQYAVYPSGTLIGKIMYRGTQGNTTNVEAPTFYGADDENLGGTLVSGAATYDDTLRTITLSSSKRAIMIRAFATATHTPGAAAAFYRNLTKIALYGDSGITTRPNGSEPDGLYASDVMRHIAQNWAPKLSTAGVVDTTYPISHLVWLDEVYPHDAFKELNKFHLWKLGVWEGKSLTFAPYDLSQADWEVRGGEEGVSIDLQGDSSTDAANGIIVHFTDFTGAAQRLTPDDTADLKDTNELLPANSHGETNYTSLTISQPCSSDDAVQMGRAALAEFNRPKKPGTITVTGHIRDGAGHWQQGWKPRAGDTIAITNFTDAAPRLITKTSWSDRSKQLTLTLDNALNRFEVIQERQQRALQAAGIS